ncbi:MAG: SNF2-related protein [Planctomycetota bacterium]|nr:SNF2-related protein [Planctomycetota bacterium]
MQAIIAARLLWRERFIRQILVICPKTLIPTWYSEIDKWWPQISGNIMLPGTDRQFFLRIGTPNVVIKIINYEAIAREAEWLDRQLFSHDLIIIDEAQRIKNPIAKTSQAVRSLHAERRWALTGTPLENSVDDVCSIFQFVKPGLIGDTTDPRVVSSRIAPFMLRRRTDEVDIDLPEKSEQDCEIELTGSQRRTYDQMESEGVVELNAKGDSITVTHVFALITKLRQICNCDPVSGDSAKLERLLGDLEEVRDSGRKALVFSQFVDEQYGLKHLAKELQQADYGILELHGDIKQSQREAVKERFQKQRDIHVLLVSYKVGGEGLNLQAANYVFLFDRWFNPAVEDQAVKRVHRIGQANKVFIRKFYCEDTFEERILKILARKRSLFRTVIDEACPEPDSFGLTEEEIFSLFNLSVRPKRGTPKSSPKVKVNLEGMDPLQFEELAARLYEAQGYTVQLTPRSHDGGIDLIAERISSGGRERVVAQCKHQQANVGRPILQQLWGIVSSDQSYSRGDLVTSSGFTSEAVAFAEGKRLTLIDRALLIQLARQADVADFTSG